jgi:hypothetical protein
MTQEALKLALEALEGLKSLYGGKGHKLHEINMIHRKHDTAITALEKVLAEHAMRETQRLGQEIEQEPVCPDCKAKVLYECVACSSNNYPPKETT